MLHDFAAARAATFSFGQLDDDGFAREVLRKPRRSALRRL
jgi:hypothetical protein